MTVLLNYCALVVCLIFTTIGIGEPIELHFPNGTSWSGDSEEVVKIVTTDGIKIGTIDKITPYNFTVTTKSGKSTILDLQIVQSCETFSNSVDTPNTPNNQNVTNPTVSSITGPVDEDLASLVSQIDVFATLESMSGGVRWEITAVMAQGEKSWVRTPKKAHQKRISTLDRVGFKWIVPRGDVHVSITVGRNNPIPLVALLLSDTVQDQFANSGMPKPIDLVLKNGRKIVVPSTLEGPLRPDSSDNRGGGRSPSVPDNHGDDNTPSDSDNRVSKLPSGSAVDNGWRINGISRSEFNKSWNLSILKIIEKLMRSLRVVLVLNETDVVLAKLVSKNGRLQLSAEASEKLVDSSVVNQGFRDTAVAWVHLIAEYQHDLQIEKPMAKNVLVSEDWGMHKALSSQNITVQLPCAHCSGRGNYKPKKYTGEAICRGCAGSGYSTHAYTSKEVSSYWKEWDLAVANAVGGMYGWNTEINIEVPCYNHYPKTRTDIWRSWWIGVSLAVGKIDSLVGQCVQVNLSNNSLCTVENFTMDDKNQLAVSFSTVGSEQLTADEASSSPSKPVDPLVDGRHRRVESPRNIFNGARFVFVNDVNEMRVLKYNARTGQLEPVELLFEEWQQIRESLKQ